MAAPIWKRIAETSLQHLGVGTDTLTAAVVAERLGLAHGFAYDVECSARFWSQKPSSNSLARCRVILHPTTVTYSQSAHMTHSCNHSMQVGRMPCRIRTREAALPNKRMQLTKRG